MTRFSHPLAVLLLLQGDTSGCSSDFVDIIHSTSYVLVKGAYNKTFVVISTKLREQLEVSPCTII